MSLDITREYAAAARAKTTRHELEWVGQLTAPELKVFCALKNELDVVQVAEDGWPLRTIR